jgi:hypothetical protein
VTPAAARRQNVAVPYVAVVAHKLLGDVAAVRMALHLLESEGLSEAQRTQATSSLTLRLDALEEGLKELITAPRDESVTT